MSSTVCQNAGSAETAQRILVTFGGTDPANLASRFSRVLAGLDLDLENRVIVGPGAEPVEMPAGISVATDITSMAAEMVGADLVVTSAGRTVYEAALRDAVVALAQNAKGRLHMPILELRPASSSRHRLLGG